jgi:putative hydrolase of the HAD superfamily
VKISAVVFDIGGVLELVEDHAWPVAWATRWATRTGMTLDDLDARLAHRPAIGDLVTGAASESDFRSLYAGALGLDEAGADAMMREMWDAYCGTLDQRLFDRFTGLRGRVRLGILSNSADGARREESRRFGIPDAADVVVYSHEVGLAKPDPAIYALTTDLLAVPAGEVAFLDDRLDNVEAAQAFGWRALLHRDTAESVAWLDGLLAGR